MWSSNPTDMRNHDPRWQPGDFEKNLEAIAQIPPTGGFGARYAEQSLPTWI